MTYSMDVVPKNVVLKSIELQDQKHIETMIKVLNPRMEKVEKIKIAELVSYTSKRYQIDPKLILAIIAIESNFNHDAVSTTGDLSLAQINPTVWSKEFKRLGLGELNIHHLKHNKRYALIKMGQILNELKNRYAKKDKEWYARYHSGNLKFKELYVQKLQNELEKIKHL